MFLREREKKTFKKLKRREEERYSTDVCFANKKLGGEGEIH